MLIELITVLSAIATAVVGSLTFWPVQSGWDFYIPIVLYLATYIGVLALWWIVIWIFGLHIDQKHEHNKPNAFAKFWFLQCVTFTDYHAYAKVRVSGLRRLPKNSRFLLVCNHRSNFDPMIISDKIGYKDIAFIAKRDTFKIPLAHRMMWGICFMPIDRDDVMQSLSVMRRAESLLKNDATSVGVFPEGTRHPDGVLGEFHEGVFNVAIRAKVPVVVCSMSGAENIHKNFPFKGTPIRFDILETIPVEEIEGMTAKEIADEAREIISFHLERIEAK